MEIPDDLEKVADGIFNYDRAEVDGTPPESIPASLVLIRAFAQKAFILVTSPSADLILLLEPGPERDEILTALSIYLMEVNKSIARAQVDSHLWFHE